MRPSFRATLVFPGIAFATYANSLGNGFVFDDDQVLVSNASIRSVEGLGCILRESCRPVRHLSYALDCALFGRKPWGYHLSNVLYHALACLLVLALRASARNRDWKDSETPWAVNRGGFGAFSAP